MWKNLFVLWSFRTYSSLVYKVVDTSPSFPVMSDKESSYTAFIQHYYAAVNKFKCQDPNYFHELNKALYHLSYTCIPHRHVHRYFLSSLIYFQTCADMHLIKINTLTSSYSLPLIHSTPENLFNYASIFSSKFAFICTNKSNREDIDIAAWICLKQCYYIMNYCMYLFLLNK
jgi:hypothetical protein